MIPILNTLRNIVVGADLQASSSRTLAIAAELSKHSQGALHLVHVTTQPEAHTPSASARHDEMLNEAQRALNIVRDRLVNEQVNVASVECFATGRPEDRLLERAGDVSADLIIVGSTAREGHGHRLGSTADRVVRAGEHAVLVVRGETPSEMRRVAILTDFSEAATLAAHKAVSWLPSLMSSEHPSPGDGTMQVDFVHAGDERVLAMDATVDSWSRQRLDEEVGHFKPAVPAGIEVRQRLLWGTHPVDTIERAAAENDWHLIIVGGQGKGTVTRWVVGSVAIGLCQGAPCPVLVMPPR